MTLCDGSAGVTSGRPGQGHLLRLIMARESTVLSMRKVYFYLFIFGGEGRGRRRERIRSRLHAQRGTHHGSQHHDPEIVTRATVKRWTLNGLSPPCAPQKEKLNNKGWLAGPGRVGLRTKCARTFLAPGPVASLGQALCPAPKPASRRHGLAC